MSVKRYIVVLAVMFSALGAAAGKSPATLTMHVTPVVSSDNDVSLRFQLRYTGQDSLEAQASSLPGVQRRFTIALDVQRYPDYDNPAGRPCANLQDIITIDDPGPGWKSVNSGQEFVEDVRLADLYKGVGDVLGRCELVVNWSYKMYTRDKIRFPRMAGSVVIPSSRRPVIPSDVSVQGDPWKYEKTP